MSIVSIAMATYNGARFLPEQLRSILAQTRRPDQIVVSDDGSTDGTPDLVRAMLEGSGIPFQVVPNPGARGSTGNFENAIRHCTGDVVFLCDQDDSWYPRKIEVQAGILDGDPAIDYCFGNADLVDHELRPLGKDLWTSLGLWPWIERYPSNQAAILVMRPLVTGAASVFRRDLLLRTMPYPPSWVHDRWISVLGSCVGAVGKPLEDRLFAYRQHPAQQLSALAGQTAFGKLRFVLSVDSTACAKESRKLRALEARLRLLDADGEHVREIHDSALHVRVRGILGGAGFLGRFGRAERERRAGRYRFSSFPGSYFRDILLSRRKAGS